MAQASRDENSVPTLLAASNVDGKTPVRVYADPVTHRLLVDMNGGGTGTVTSVSVATDNGFAGTVADPTTTPTITLETTVTGIVKGDGTALSAAVANTDYQIPITLTTTGSSGAATFDGETLNIPEYAGGGGGTVDSVVGTTDRITVDSTDPANPVVDIASTYVGQTSITTLGTIGTGTWNATDIAPGAGGTGISNTGTITVSGNTVLGSNTDTLTLTTTGNTNVTLPTSGTLATTTQIANMVTAAATFATDESILRSDGTSRGAQASSTNATLTDAGAMTLASSATAARFIPSGSTVPTNGLYLPSANTLGWAVNSAAEMQLTSTALSPAADGGSSLGTTALGWQNLFGNTGFVLNIENSNWVATHTSGILTVGTGDLRVTTAGTNAASVVTNAGTQTITNKRNQPRTASSTTSSNLSPDLSVANVYFRTTQTATLTIDAPTGTPVIGEVILMYIDSAGAQTVNFNATYIPFGAAFPATTTAGKTLMISAQYNGTNWKTLWANAV